MRIAILFHKAEKDPSKYMVHGLVDTWREDGHSVEYVMGVRRKILADVLLVHVDLSVVPDPYLEYASSFPIVLNGGLADIRKSCVSKSLIKQNDSWQGPVIAKSDRNSFGFPEEALEVNWLERSLPLLRRIHCKINRMRGLDPLAFAPEGYRVFNSINEIPEEWFSHPRIVLERFRPEIENGDFHLRMYMFLGDRARCTRLRSSERIVKAHNSLAAEDIEPHDAAIEWRREFSVDYGKIDYVMHDGEPVLLDINKTIGATPNYKDEETLRSNRRFIAEGLYALLT